ncbi:MAG: hypothetical protein ACRECY_18010 [Phyllobacterium sp.]
MHQNRLVQCLEALKESDGLTRTQLAHRLSLHPVTVGLLVRRLVDAELVTGRPGCGDKVRGRPVTALSLNPSGMYFMGVHVDATFISCGLLDFKSNQIGHAVRPVAKRRIAEGDLKAEIASIIRTAVCETGTPEHRVFGVGMCVSDDAGAEPAAASASCPDTHSLVRSVSREGSRDWQVHLYAKEAARSAYLKCESSDLQVDPMLRAAFSGDAGSICLGAALLLQKSIFCRERPKSA